MAKNRQKMAKIIRKIDFLYNNFPKKAISLRKCTQKKNAFGEKKVQITVGTPPRATEFLSSALLRFCPYT